MIIPKQYLKAATIKRTGLGSGLFAQLRYKEDETENPEFVLNKPAIAKPDLLLEANLVLRSREHVPRFSTLVLAAGDFRRTLLIFSITTASRTVFFRNDSFR